MTLTLSGDIDLVISRWVSMKGTHTLNIRKRSSRLSNLEFILVKNLDRPTDNGKTINPLSINAWALKKEQAKSFIFFSTKYFFKALKVINFEKYLNHNRIKYTQIH